MNGESMDSILVILETASGELSRGSLEAIVCAQQLAPKRLTAVLLGGEGMAMPDALATLRLDKVSILRHDLLAHYTADAWVGALCQVVAAAAPTLILMPHSYQGRDFAPRLAARLGHALISDCIGIERDDAGLAFIRQMFQGRAHMRLRMRGEAPHLVTLQPGAYRIESAEQGAAAPVSTIDIALSSEQIRVSVEAPFKASTRTVDLGRADIIVAVGRGIKGPEHIVLAQRLADLLGAELAASRPVCDEGWLPLERQVGSSGQTVSPRLYIAIGISGAVQHAVGMKGSDTIVAINKDANAPIFKIADYGIVGDLFNILPALIQSLEAGG
jgi:electron transfer flavoprotein alpha subunit